MRKLNITESDLKDIQQCKPLTWLNTAYQNTQAAPLKPNNKALYEAQNRLQRFAPLLAELFPELEHSKGLIESPLVRADNLNSQINFIGGSLFLKTDNDLPVAGSIKARGGIHEVLCFAQELGLKHGLIHENDTSFLNLGSADAKKLFNKYTIIVGSTGNLGLSIGVIGSALGFKTVVHMSSDAKQWKKQRLRSRGVTVIEHQADYAVAVDAGRKEAQASAFKYFVDDERSPELFMGYAVAALRLKEQLSAAARIVDAKHPLFVYLPAGVGGAPGGITFGLKLLFGDHVHCFFAEPIQAPCMLLGMAGEPNSPPTSIYELGLNIDTDADGLAVGTASQWVCDATRDLLAGVFTATDEKLYEQLYLLNTLENIKVEPSSAIACLGMHMLNTEKGKAYLTAHKLHDSMEDSTHIAWLTGGSFVPKEEYNSYLNKAKFIHEQFLTQSMSL